MPPVKGRARIHHHQRIHPMVHGERSRHLTFFVRPQTDSSKYTTDLKPSRTGLTFLIIICRQKFQLALHIYTTFSSLFFRTCGRASYFLSFFFLSFLGIVWILCPDSCCLLIDCVRRVLSQHLMLEAERTQKEEKACKKWEVSFSRVYAYKVFILWRGSDAG